MISYSPLLFFLDILVFVWIKNRQAETFLELSNKKTFPGFIILLLIIVSQFTYIFIPFQFIY